jgi:hypothetical protein
MTNYLDWLRKPVAGASLRFPGGQAQHTITLGRDHRTQLAALLEGAPADVVEQAVEAPAVEGQIVTKFLFSNKCVDSYD